MRDRAAVGISAAVTSFPYDRTILMTHPASLASLAVESLRTEHTINPIGIHEPRPRLGWKLVAPNRKDVMQTAYEIRAARTPEARDGNDLLWHTGRIESSRSIDVHYEGTALRLGERAYWWVRVWDNSGNVSAWSAPAFFEMGLLDFAQRASKWIGADLVGDKQTSVASPLLRKVVTAKSPIARARLYVTALGFADLSINGKPVTDAIFRPGWTDYRKRVQYDAYDVTALLHDGTNALTAILGDGWYCGHIANGGRQLYGDRPRLRAELHLHYTDGTSEITVTDESWKLSTDGPITSSDLLMGETYDGTKEIAGWENAAFDDASWKAATVFSAPQSEISPALGPPVRRTMELQPISAPALINGALQYDFGQNISGRVRITVRGPRGGTVTIRQGEILENNEPGKPIYLANLRSAKATDTLILGGDGTTSITWEPRFTVHGFRYAEFICTPGVTIETAIAVVIHTDLPIVGSFECSDPLVNQLQKNIVWGQRGNFLEVPTDCPQRDERLGWCGDTQVFCRTAMFNMDMQSFFTKWLRDVRDAQPTTGAVPPFVPHTASFGMGADGGPAWADVATILPWTQFASYGDKGILQRQYESISAFLDFENRQADADGIRCRADFPYSESAWKGFGDWLSTDQLGTAWDGGTPNDIIGTAFFAFSSQLAAKMARALGRSDDATRWEKQHERVRAGFIKHFVDADGSIKKCTQTGAVLGLHFDLLPEKSRPIVLKWLLDDIDRRGGKLCTGFVGTPYIQHVLSTNGANDVAYRLLFQKGWPSWLYAVTRGATTIWERWDGWTEDKGFQDVGMNSFNHYAYGAVGDWLYGTVAGINTDPQRPGYEHIRFQPRPGPGLTSTSARVETPRGLVEAAWEITGGTLHYRVVVPPNATATVILPKRDGSAVSEKSVGSGSHAFTLPWPAG
jgi:alpha-L-rhamnosidase